MGNTTTIKSYDKVSTKMVSVGYAGDSDLKDGDVLPYRIVWAINQVLMVNGKATIKIGLTKGGK